MLPSRFVSGQQNAMRKSRLEGKPSLLPKPRRPGSTDRLSTEARRPSTAGHRSSSAEPARGTFGGSRLSREASATKLPLNGRSRSQQGDRFGQSSMTPLRSSHYSRPTTTPVRTPSEDRASRSWQTSLERALAFVTIKDQRPISAVAWQRAECARVGEALAGRGEGGGMALIRPLTIARFVDIAAALLSAITSDAKLNTDNYVTKLPHLSKRLLYPGTVSKSWLKTVNTLHAFPHALALISYLLDLVSHIEMPVSDEWLYVGKDELACLRRDYLYKCWIRFQDPGHQFEDLNDQYLQNLKLLLGNDEEKIAELTQIIKKYEACLNDEVEVAARRDEARRVERRDALLAGLRAERAGRHADRAQCAALRTAHHDAVDAIKHLDVEIERANAESQQLKHELETQPLTVEQRTKLLDDVDYALRVQDSKRALAEQIAKMVLTKETELALWQKKTLDSCVEYKQGLIHLSAQFPDLASLAIDEKELMSPECGASVSSALSALRGRSAALAQLRTEHAREKSALARKRATMLEETRTKIAEIKTSVQREQEALDTETSKETLDTAAAVAELRELNERMQELRQQQDEYAKIDTELQFWEQQDQLWRSKLLSLQEYINSQRIEAQRLLDNAREKRVQIIVNCVREWNDKLAH
ncbi:kinetochore protein NDC80 homolog [Anticarsia gemmatalis]|uniref:kinetochore protein NDC80 homolog n=1 Tax=Anticarsia gemmatalis TaxID=129554 RepID=UPI003F7626B9